MVAESSSPSPAVGDRSGRDTQQERIGVVSVPWVGVPPRRQGSIAGKTHRITTALADRYHFTIVGGTTGRAPHREHPYIDYVPIDDRLDKRYIDRLVHAARRATGRRRHLFEQIPYHPVYSRRAAAALAAAGCSTVVVHEFPQWLPVFAKALPDARLILWGGADTFIEIDELLPYVRRADALIGASRFLAGRFAERVPELADRSYAVYSGVDTNRFRPADVRPATDRITFAGRITPEKGVHVLVDAFRMLAGDRPDLELVLAGPLWVSEPTLLHSSVPHHMAEVIELARSDYRQELLRRAGPHADRVRLLGPLGGEEMIRCLQEATVFCHPMLWEEGFGTVIAEAMACGIPTVVSDLGAPPEYISHRVSGMISPAGNAEQLASILDELLADAALRAALGREARRTAEDRLSTTCSAAAFADVLAGTATPVVELDELR